MNTKRTFWTALVMLALTAGNNYAKEKADIINLPRAETPDHVAQAMNTGDPKVTWMAAAYAPIVAIVFFVLAHRGIKKDEMKVRAADRIR